MICDILDEGILLKLHRFEVRTWEFSLKRPVLCEEANIPENAKCFMSSKSIITGLATPQ